MYKRYANYEGGVADPLLIAWPKGIRARGELRHQYCHVVDIVPTIYDCLGIEPPEELRGYAQSELEGDSFAHTLDDGSAPTGKRAQLYAMLGTRGIWFEGWHASTVHPAGGGWGGFERDRWELFHLDEDRTQTRDLAAEHPDKLEQLKTLWAMLAGRYHALPLDDRTAVELLAEERPEPGRPRDHYVYYPGCEPVPQGVAASVVQRAFDVTASVVVEEEHPNGVIFAQGSDIGGHTLYLKDGRLHYVYNWLGELQQKIEASEPLAPGRHTLGLRFDVQRRDQQHSPVGPARLFIDDEEVASGEIKTQPAFFGLEGVITVGRDVGRPASDDYVSPNPLRGGAIEKVIVGVRGAPHKDPETEAQMAQRRD
jgi:arylsulfatase